MPIDTQENGAEKAHIKVIYFVEDVVERLDLFFRPGRHKISYIVDKINQKYKEVQQSKHSKTSLLAEFYEMKLAKLFTNSEITFNFMPKQQLTTYAYIIDKKLA